MVLNILYLILSSSNENENIIFLIRNHYQIQKKKGENPPTENGEQKKWAQWGHAE